MVSVPAGTGVRPETVLEAVRDWNAQNGRACGIIFLPVFIETEAARVPGGARSDSTDTGDRWLALLPGEANDGTGRLATNLTGGRVRRSEGRRKTVVTGQPVSIAFDSLAALKATVHALLTDYCGRGQSVPVPPLSPRPEFEIAEIARLYARWEAEKLSCPRTLGKAQTILRELDQQVDAAASENTIDPVSLSREIGQLARYRVRTDGGQSYVQFWQRGDRVFERLARAARSGSGPVIQNEAAAGLEGCGR